MRSCPYCAEQIQDAAIVCRFCGRDVSPLVQNKTERPASVRLPAQRWYSLDERVKAKAPEPERPPKRTSIWAKLGGALDILEPKALKPNRTGARETMVRDYQSVREYREDVDRLIKVGWVIQRQSEGPPLGGTVTLRYGDDTVTVPRQHIVVTWIREPNAEGG